MALDAFIFDLDGTLVDTNAAHVESWVRAFARLGYKVFADRILPEIGKGGDNLVPAILGTGAEQRDGEALREAVKEEFLAIARQRRFDVITGARELIAAVRARGLRTVLGTSSGTAQLDAIAAASGTDFRELVDDVVDSTDVESTKPSPDVVLAALGKLGVSPAQCVMVGDTPHDAESARRAGVATFGVLSGGGTTARALREAGARHVWRNAAGILDDLDEALRIASPGSAHFTAERLDALMRDALSTARAALDAGALPVSAIVATGDGEVVARAADESTTGDSRTAHAPLIAMREACRRVEPGRRDLVVVTTVEPCVMCTGAAVELAADTLVYGLPAPADAGTARVRPPAAGIAQMPRVIGGIRAAESRELLERWLAAHPPSWRAEFVREVLRTAAG